jgi:putative spermidine/putrescine transport system substrate-binding protein
LGGVAWHDRRSGAACLAIASAAILVAGACGASPSPSPSAAGTGTPRPSAVPTASPPPPVAHIGKSEGELDIVVRPGYAERGDNDAAYDWVTPFEEDSGCKVKAFEAGTSEQAADKIRTEGAGTWDGLSAGGDVSRGLIAEGLVQSIDVGLFTAWNDLWPPLQDATPTTVDGLHYGIAQGWGANQLLWNRERVKPDPTSWQILYDPESEAAGRITILDSPIAMADAALYLASTRPDLLIRDPFELSSEQLGAVIDLLKIQRPLVGTYWGTPLDQIAAFEDGSAVLGAGWPSQAHVLLGADPPVPVKGVLPVEGATGWQDSWLLLRGARHPSCMLRWMAWMIRPQVQKMVAEYVGEAPANLTACEPLDEHHGPLGFDKFCDFYHAHDEAYARGIVFWKTPLADCGDTRGATCTDYATWRQQWDEIKASR